MIAESPQPVPIVSERTQDRAKSASTQVWDRVLLALLFAATIFKLWILPLRNGFWLDETGTFWAASGSLADAYRHTISWPSHTVLYTLISWAAMQMGGKHELALRLPSLIGLLVGAFTLYRLGVRLLSREAAVAATLGFICTEAVYFAAADARPYALGTAAVIVSTYFLIRWFDSNALRYALCYGLALSFAIQMQYVFGTIVLVHLVYIASCAWRGDVPPRRQFWLAAGILVITLIPLIPHFQSTFLTRKTHSFVGPPLPLDLWGVIAPPLLAGSAVLGILLAFFVYGHSGFVRRSIPSPTAALICGWAILPGLALYSASSVMSLGLFMPRYPLTAVPGSALLLGWLVSTIHPLAPRRFIVAAIAAAAMGSSGGLLHPTHGGDWRRAVELANAALDGPDTPVLVRSGFIESAYLDVRQGTPHSDELFAPLAVYPLHAKVIRLSFGFRPQDASDLQEVSKSLLARTNRFVLITSGDSAYEYWLLGHLTDDGFRIDKTTRVGGLKDTLRVVVFSKRS